MRIFSQYFIEIGLVAAWTLGIDAQTPRQLVSARPDQSPLVALPPAVTDIQPSLEEAITNPLADPKAMVVLGHARIIVLTPQLIRMECSANEKFEDHASFVFLNRRLPAPKFESEVTKSGSNQTLTVRTDALTITYTANGDGCFTPDNLSITLTVEGKPVIWHPGLGDPENLLGTTRTLDTARGGHTVEPIEQGLVSRSGWALVDDSTRPLFDSADFRFLDGEEALGRGFWSALKTKRPVPIRTGTSLVTVTTTAARSATLCGWPGAFHCRRASPSGCGGRVIGRIPTRSSTSLFVISG